MNILDSLMFVLIAGILGSVNAYEERYERSEIVPSHLFLLGYVNTSIADIEKYDAQLCAKNGGAKAYDTQARSSDQLSICTYSVFAEVNHENSVKNYTSESIRQDDYFVLLCKRVPDLENCYKNVTDDMKICLDPDKHESTNIIYNVMSSLMNFACQDGATRLKTWTIGNTTRECLRSKKSALTDCAQQSIVKSIRATILDGASIGGIGALHLLIPDANKCAVLEKFQLCAVKVLKTCATSTTSKLADSLVIRV